MKANCRHKARSHLTEMQIWAQSWSLISSSKLNSFWVSLMFDIDEKDISSFTVRSFNLLRIFLMMFAVTILFLSAVWFTSTFDCSSLSSWNDLQRLLCSLFSSLSNAVRRRRSSWRTSTESINLASTWSCVVIKTRLETNDDDFRWWFSNVERLDSLSLASTACSQDNSEERHMTFLFQDAS